MTTRPRVLLVDDVDANLVALEAHLSNLGCDLVRANTGNEALRQLLKSEFAVMLLDVQMPDMDGYEVARYARENPATRDVPIIFVTATDETEENLLRGYGAGVVDYLFKPVNPQILRGKVQVFLDLYLSRERKRVIESLEESVRVRDEFLSIASHELRTPLTALQLQQQGILRVLQKTPAEGPHQRLLPRLEIAIVQAARLATLIENLLDVSRIAMGRLSLELSEVDLTALVEDVLAELGEMLANAQCTVEVRSGAPVAGRWDRSRIQQTITNLLSNVVKFGAGKPVEIAIAKHDDTAVLAVRDHGIGISPQDQARIFGRFERAVSARNFGGLGLGLYISRQIVEAHGGSIALESELGVGSTFTVRLPLQSPVR